MRPYYLPRELSHVIALTVYISPSANSAAATETLQNAVSELQALHPHSLLLICGDFNHASLQNTLPTFTQYVDCHTRDNKTLDLMYANVKDAYTSSPLPPLGRSDHNLVHLIPQYTPLVIRQPPTTRRVQRWTEDASEALRDCFECTDWDALCGPHGDDIDSMTECITGYINFCVENTVPTRKVRCFSNNKPWVTPELKALLNEKKRVFSSGDKEELRRVQRELKWRIRRGKAEYRRRLEQRMQDGNARDVWRGLKTISGHSKSGEKEASLGDKSWADQLNQFFCRFDTSPSPSLAASSLHPPSPPPLHTSAFHPGTTVGSPAAHQSLSIATHQVRSHLQRIKARKAAGPDGISSRVLRDCAGQLCEVMQLIFNLSLRLQRVPVLWKTSCVVPVPKAKHPRELNHYRPVALTSHLMKTMERIILNHLRPLVSPVLDPLQFAYRANIGVEDAVIFLLHRSLSHLEGVGGTVRVMFFDFSSAFNTIQPFLLRGKLQRAGVDHRLTAWVTDYLTSRPQYVRLRDCVSDVAVCSTGAPQGTVLAPFLFTLYTSDFTHNTSSCHLQKFSDDTAIVGCVSKGDEREYRTVINDFVSWCGTNQLQINTSKTKELVIDFRRKVTRAAPVNIQGLDIEMVEDYKYLGVHLNNKLDWSHNTGVLHKKGQSRLHLLRRLRSFGVCRRLLKSFFDTVVASAVFYAVVCWSSGSTERDRGKLNKLVRRASHVVGCPLDSVEEVGERRMLSKLTSMMNNSSHPLHETVLALSSSFSNRLVHPRCKKERFRRSFIPTAVRLFNENC